MVETLRTTPRPRLQGLGVRVHDLSSGGLVAEDLGSSVPERSHGRLQDCRMGTVTASRNGFLRGEGKIAVAEVALVVMRHGGCRMCRSGREMLVPTLESSIAAIQDDQSSSWTALLSEEFPELREELLVVILPNSESGRIRESRRSADAPVHPHHTRRPWEIVVHLQNKKPREVHEPQPTHEREQKPSQRPERRRTHRMNHKLLL